MKYQTISEIYEANDQIRARLKALIGGLTAGEAERRDGDGWTVAEIVEHLEIVEDGMTRICAKLLGEGAAAGAASNGGAKISADFLERTIAARKVKVEAPERVRPTGKKTVADSIVGLDANRVRLNQLREQFESVDSSAFTFPHPAFGDLTAHEWLALLGGHEARHIAQIERILAA
jgi:hypothetical protein